MTLTQPNTVTASPAGGCVYQAPGQLHLDGARHATTVLWARAVLQLLRSLDGDKGPALKSTTIGSVQPTANLGVKLT